MRSAPFRLAVFDPFETAARCSYLTQGHPTASLSAGAFASIIHDLVHGDSLEHAVQQALTVSPATPRTRRPLAYCAPPSNWPPGPGQPPKRSNHSPDGSRTRHSRSPSTARSPNPTPPSKALLLAVNQSGDSDSARAICGNNLSAQHGFRLLPADWVDAVEGRQTIVKITYDLLAEPTSHSYRTDHYPLLRRTLLFRPARRTGPDRRRAWTRHSAARATTSCACTPPGDQVLKLFPTRGLRTMRAAHKDESNFIVPTYSRVGSP
ncbi:ADP-ribosylglycohydrolase family protein [Microbispora sp. H10949]